MYKKLKESYFNFFIVKSIYLNQIRPKSPFYRHIHQDQPTIALTHLKLPQSLTELSVFSSNPTTIVNSGLSLIQLLSSLAILKLFFYLKLGISLIPFSLITEYTQPIGSMEQVE